MRQRVRRRLLNGPSVVQSPSTSDPVVLLGSLTRSLRAGLTLRQAIIECGAHRTSDLAHRIAAQLQRGRSLTDVCSELSAPNHRRGALSEEELLVIRVIGLTHTLGGDEAGLLESVMHGIVERRQSRYERLAQASTAMSSMRLLTWLPVVCGIWIVSENPTTRHFLLHTPGGHVCSIIGCLLNLLGRFWSRRIVAGT